MTQEDKFRLKTAHSHAKTICKEFLAGKSFDDLASEFGVDTLAIENIYRKQMKRKKK